MAKKRTMNQYRQTKDTYYKVPTHDPQTGELNPNYEEVTGQNNPLDVYGDEYRKSFFVDFRYQVQELRKQYPNDQEFGYEVAKLLRGISWRVQLEYTE